ncbi:MAG: fatty acid desaturase [Gemmatimonadaceae bacterium]
MSALAELRQLVAPYEKPEHREAWKALATSVPPYLVLWWLMYSALDVSYWLTLVLAVLAAGFLVRTFIVQHDCGHGSFFRSARLNVRVGRACSLFTLIPYGYWRRSHGTHHATSGKLADRGADIDTRTVREYLAMSARQRLVYRMMRNPIVLFVVAPTLYFVLAMRLPWMARASWRRERRSIVLTNLALLTAGASLAYAIGFGALIRVQLPITMIASTIGMWLFYVQHQFEHTYWAPEGAWDYGRAALEGSSYYALPAVLEWFTGYIGVHHVHHLGPRVPSYRLAACHAATPLFAGVPRIGLGDGIRCARLKLWDEDSRRLIGWRELAATVRALLLLAATAIAVPLYGQAPRLSIAPLRPEPGAIVRVTLTDVQGIGDSVVTVRGTMAGEPLHFTSSHGEYRAIGAIPVDTSSSIIARAIVTRVSGRADTVRASAAVPPLPPPTERLAVAPRFGKPLSPAIEARVAREGARALEVGRRAHESPVAWSEPFLAPRTSAVSSRFGTGRTFNGQVTSRHLGVDFRGAVGAPVRAANRGRVALIDTFFLGGRVIYIDHGGGIVTGYLHLSRVLVSVGDTVTRGQMIGHVGATGRVTGPHLHWNARYGSLTVNPLDLLTLKTDN